MLRVLEEALTSARERLAPKAALVLVTLIGAAFRLVYISQPMRYDEAATWLYYSSKWVLYALVSYTYPNNHIFHTLLVGVSTSIFGNHPWAIRLPAFLAGVAMIPLTYFAARRYGETTGLVAAAFVASSSVLIEFSTNARGYTIVASIFLGLIALMPSLMRGEARAWKWFAILSALGFFTIPTMLFPFGIVVCWIAFSIARTTDADRAALARRLLQGLLFTTGLLFALYLPAILWSGPHAVFANRFVTPQPWDAFARTIGDSLRSTWLGWNRGLGETATITLVFFAFLGVVREKMGLPIAAVTWCFALLVVGRWVPFHRVWTFLIPLYWIAAAAGIATLARRSKWLVPVAIVLCLAIGGSVLASGSVVRSTETGIFPDAERVALALRALGPQDRVIASPRTDAPLLYYARLHGEQIVFGPTRAVGAKMFVVVDTAEGETLEQLARQFGTATVPASTLEQGTLFRRFARARVYLVG
ncbi:MAG: glycosyltransferase family 39 protein [Actinomycetota bacterium]